MAKLNTKLKSYKDVLDVYRQHKQAGLTDKGIYEGFIYPKFTISKRTFDYIKSNAVKQKLKLAQQN